MRGQGLIQKEKVDIDGEKGAIVAKEIVTQGWTEIMIMKYKQALLYICFLFSCYYAYIMLFQIVW